MKYLSSFNGKDDIGFSFKQARNKDFNTSLFFALLHISGQVIYIFPLFMDFLRFWKEPCRVYDICIILHSDYVPNYYSV